MKKTIKVDYLARVEGEGALYIDIKDQKVESVKLKIFEPPRFFEAFLQGRKYTEAPDITARICGICPVAYQMSAVHAMENVLKIPIDKSIRALRRLLYCGEWIESHVLHIYMLHAPDFLGYPDAITMAKDFPDIVKNGLQLKKAGNEIVKFIGGREIHPVNVRVGGFYKVPLAKDFVELRKTLENVHKIAVDTVRWTANLPFPDFEQSYSFVALAHPEEYPFNEGSLISDNNLDIAPCEYENHFYEEHIEHSNALHSVLKGTGAYMVGPMARYNLNRKCLPQSIQQIAQEVGMDSLCKNPFKSIIIRSLEVLFCVEEALRIIDNYEIPESPFTEPTEFIPGSGYSITEAPRGILYHRYELDEAGIIKLAKIVPPTSQNQKTIENDLFHFVEQNLSLDHEMLTLRCEQAVRNYDPCISCATHFLKLHINR